jgi:DNA repair protein RadC
MSEKQRQDERRKQLLQQNAQILTDSELVALLLRSLSPRKDSS